ncbi:MAG TPA: hypothetical protein VEV44_07400, partial [Pseudoneobacillus sp.]|nr:hypothetical protein [Pseudoneobacillus sp.]
MFIVFPPYVLLTERQEGADGGPSAEYFIKTGLASAASPSRKNSNHFSLVLSHSMNEGKERL